MQNSDEKLCGICKSNENITKHHIINRSFQGSDEETNIIYLCEDCHRKLHNALQTSTRKMIRCCEPEKNINIKGTSFELRAGSAFIESPFNESFDAPLYGVDFYNPLSRSKQYFEVTMASGSSTVVSVTGSPAYWCFYSYAKRID